MGEEKLKNILDMNGMTEGIDYEMQITSDDGLIRLHNKYTGDLKLVIDSKVSIQDYLSAVESTDETARNIYFQKNASK